MSAYLDGNVLAGALGEVFAVDVTSATGRCVSCGTSGATLSAVPAVPGWTCAGSPASN